MRLFYRFGLLSGRFIFLNTMRLTVIRPEAVDREGPLLLAMSHLSHMEPFLISVLIRRQVDWVARIEFYKYKPIAWMLNWLDTIPVRRFGVPVSAVRASLKRLGQGRIVGICPEGGVAQGQQSCMRGAPIKRGVCLLSYRTGVPVLPCVMLGADKLNQVKPWLPFKRARLWIAFGDRLIEPRQDLDRKAARKVMAAQLQAEYVKLYRELIDKTDVDESTVP
jgi:1-acyl-sn-glycerol-3-phosphate acyltransferase